jgi:hypothetical protein
MRKVRDTEEKKEYRSYRSKPALAMSPLPQDFGDVVAHYNILAAVSSLMLYL